MTPDIMGPIAPPMILNVFITAAELPMTSLGINKITIASSVNLLSIGNIVLRVLEVLDCGLRDFHNDFSIPSSLHHCQLESQFH